MTPVGQVASALASFGGRLIRPGNSAFDRLAEVVYIGAGGPPALIARPNTPAEVARVLTAAADAGLTLAVRGQGHSFARYGTVEDGVVVDLRLMANPVIDARTRIGTSRASTTTGAYTRAAARYGLATGFGDHPDVGIPGLVLGGGIGYLSRRDGLTIDTVIDAQVVRADGSVVTASPTEHPDLFWALRGGGGNFGVVTRVRMALAPTATVTGGLIVFEPRADTVEALFELAKDAPDDLTLMVNLVKAPARPHLQPDQARTAIVTVQVCHAGDPRDAAAVLAPLRDAGPVMQDGIRVRPYPDLFTLAADQRGTRTLRSTGFVERFPSARARTALEQIASAPTATAIVSIRPLGGAIARVPDDATAFGHRRRAAVASIRAIDRDPARAAVGEGWVQQTAEAIDVRGPGAVNFLGTVGTDAAAAYPVDTLERLAKVKAVHDPTNLFRRNVNVEPAGAGR